jgi:hypothetical protein
MSLLVAVSTLNKQKNVNLGQFVVIQIDTSGGLSRFGKTRAEQTVLVMFIPAWRISNQMPCFVPFLWIDLYFSHAVILQRNIWNLLELFVTVLFNLCG